MIASAAKTLTVAGVATPAREARRLLALAAGGPSASFGPTDPVAPDVRRRYRGLVAARARRVPFPLLEGGTGFLDFEVVVWPGVFIPRPETEELAERAIALLGSLPPAPQILDLGTGTGVLALAVARSRPDARVVAVDASPRALACARWNVRAHALGGQVELRRSDWLARVPERFHLIVTNPPYVARPLAALDPEVRRYEPRRALDGGEDGLVAIREILSQALDHLFPGGRILIEIGDGQGEAVLRFAREAAGLVETNVEADLRGKERFFSGRCG
jgi:release factor glutamine methyltransferase